MVSKQTCNGVHVVICEDAAAAADYVAQGLQTRLRETPTSVLGLATGSTPEPVYARMVAWCESGEGSMRDATTFNLDEYCGLRPDHPKSYRTYMHERLFDAVGLPESQTNLPNGVAADIAAAAQDYESAIAATGGIDWQLLGIGGNGHIGFNEPGSSRNSRTREVQLAAATREANARFFDSMEEVPTSAITMGIDTILRADCIVLMATSFGKAEAVSSALQGSVGSTNPASFLREHANASFVLDREAASGLV
ncbi:MAG: glucosamine-6-phosphate deaminase [Planctomycetota bacterium]